MLNLALISDNIFMKQAKYGIIMVKKEEIKQIEMIYMLKQKQYLFAMLTETLY